MTDEQWRLFVESLRQRKKQLLADLSKDYSATQSVEDGITRQLRGIYILLEQVPAEFLTEVGGITDQKDAE